MLNIVIKEIKELCADKKIWIGILTVLIMIIIGTSYNRQNSEETTTKPLRLGVINHDDSSYSELLVQNFIGSETFSSLVTVTLGKEKEVKEEFSQGKLDVYLEIPKDFAVNMMHLEHAPVNVTMNISDTTKAILFQNVLKSYEKYISAVEANAVGLYDIMKQNGADQKQLEKANKEISVNLIMTALGREAFFNLKPVEQFPATPLSVYYMSSILVTALFYSGLYVGFQILKEFEQGTLLRLRTTRTLVSQFIAAKMVLLTILLTIAAVAALSVIKGKPAAIGEIILCLSIAMFCVSFAVLLSALFMSNQRFILAGNLILFFFTILGGGIIPIQYLPQDMLRISKFTPDYYLLKEIISAYHGQAVSTDCHIMVIALLSFGMAGMAIFIFGRRRVNDYEG